MANKIKSVTPKEVADGTKIKGAAEYLQRLVIKKSVIQSGNGKYSLFHPLFGEYIRGVAVSVH